MIDPDAHAVAQLRAGNRAAFDGLVQRNRDVLDGVLRRYLKSPADVADVAQETFLRAYQKIESFRGEAPFRSWLLRIGINLALNRIHGGANTQAQELADDAIFTHSLGTSRMVAAELWRKVSERIASLPPRQRLIVELRVFHELAFDEIGEVVGSSADAAKVNFHHGVKRLRGLLPSKGEVTDGTPPTRS